MSRPKVIVIVQDGRPLPPVERLDSEAEVVVVRSAEEFKAALPGAEMLFLNDFRTKLLRDVGPGELRWIHTSSIGVDSLMTREIINSDIVVSNSRGVCERPIAEWVLGVLLMFTKDLRRTIELQQARTGSTGKPNRCWDARSWWSAWTRGARDGPAAACGGHGCVGRRADSA